MARIPATSISLRIAKLTFAVTLLGTFGAHCGSDTPSEYKQLFNQPLPQQEEKFKQFPLDKQVDVYIYAMYVEPPLKRYARYLGSSGKEVLPFLVRRLEAEKSDTTKAHLIYALAEIHQHYYSLRDEKQTLESVTRVISNISDDYRKKQCQDYLEIITETPGFDG